VREDENAIDIDIELAGLNPDDVNVNVENGMLTVSGEKGTESTQGKEGQFHSVERRYGSFVRSFQLPQGVDESKITANFNHGLLTVEIPKAALPQPRRIQISGAGGQEEVQGKVGREQVSSGRSSGGATSGERMAASSPEQQGSSSEEQSSNR
jgi:HSP20 family protein